MLCISTSEWVLHTQFVGQNHLSFTFRTNLCFSTLGVQHRSGPLRSTHVKKNTAEKGRRVLLKWVSVQLKSMEIFSTVQKGMKQNQKYINGDY